MDKSRLKLPVWTLWITEMAAEYSSKQLNCDLAHLLQKHSYKWPRWQQVTYHHTNSIVLPSFNSAAATLLIVEQQSTNCLFNLQCV